MKKKISLTLFVILFASLMLNACQNTETTVPTTRVGVTIVPTSAVNTTPAPLAAQTNTPGPAKQSAGPTATAVPTTANVQLAGLGKKMCQVTDTGGIDDRSLNSLVWKGLSDTRNELGNEAKYIESTQPTDYAKNIDAFIAEQCNLIITAGQQLAEDTKAAAGKNPNQKFAIVDYIFDPTIPNVISLTFATDQAGFLAGYLAAGMTKSGRIGTFGGMQVPPVTTLMDSFFYGAQYYNQQNNTKVQVFGWDPNTQKGLFTGDFATPDRAKAAGFTLMSQGADIIMPVAGPSSVGAAEAVKLYENRWIIGVDTDWTITAANYKGIVLTSVTKNIDAAIYDTVKSVLDGSFKGGVYVGTLQNGGVGLATMAYIVSPDLHARVDQLKADLMAGKVKVNPNSK